MSENPIQPSSRPGNVRDLAKYIKLIWSLMRDRRVPALLKVLPLGAMAYLAWPLDLAPGMALPVIGALDDVAILWLGLNLFVELSPPEVVQEHRLRLGMTVETTISADEEENIIDAETQDFN